MVAVGFTDHQGLIQLPHTAGIIMDFIAKRGIADVPVEIKRQMDTAGPPESPFCIRLPCTAEKRDRYPKFSGHVTEGRDITARIGAIEEIQLVFQLHENNRAAAVDLMLCNIRNNLAIPAAHVFQIGGIVLAHLNGVIGQKPRRKGSAVPFRTDIRSRPGNNI